MRIARLDLLRYGHFTDTTLELRAGATDLHVVYGPNEAGKSTARGAIGDFLFGFPQSTAIDFLHSYAQLRIGARCETAAGPIEAIRRKGRKDTLLDADGEPSSTLDAELSRALAGADMDFFTRMFSLDHEGLRKGGQALAAAEADADSVVLAAGSGLADVLGQHAELAREAGELWAPTPAKNRRYYQAEQRLKDAEAAIREHEITVRDWQQRRDAFDTADQRYQDLTERKRNLDRQRHELERMRRVAQPVRRYQALAAELDAMGDVADLPADARTQFEAARKADDDAGLAIDQLTTLVERIDAEIADIADDPALRDVAEDIERLAEQRLRIADERERDAEIEDRLTALAGSLETDRSQLSRQEADMAWPGVGALAEARRLIGERPVIAQTLEHARELLAQTREREHALVAEQDATGTACETDTLDAWLAAHARDSDLVHERRNAVAELDRLTRDSTRRLDRLDPPLDDVTMLAGRALPAISEVESAGRHMHAAVDTLKRRQDHVDTLEDEAAHARAAHERQRAADALPSAAALAALRQRRDGFWTGLRQRLTDPVSDDLFTAGNDSDTDTFDTLLREADALADQRFERAEAITREAERARAVAEREHALAQALARRDDARTACDEHAAHWQTLWRPTGLTPGEPPAMREWLIACEAIVGIRAEQDEAAARLERLEARIADVHGQALEMLRAAGLDDPGLADLSLTVVLERAGQHATQTRQRRDEQARIVAERRKLEPLIDSQTHACDEAASAMADWQQAWRQALSGLGLAEDTPFEGAEAIIDHLDAARQRADEQHTLTAERHALAARRQRFEHAAAETLAAAAHSSAVDETAEQTSQRLSSALQQAQTHHRLVTTRRADREAHIQRIAEYRQAKKQAAADFDRLARQAASPDLEALDRAIEAAEHKRRLAAERAQITATIEAQGDGQPIADLITAVAACDLDTLREQVAVLAQQIEDLDDDIHDARDHRSAAKTAFEAIGGDERAAIAESERQTALADMADAAERYLRVGTAALLLKWAGQRYSMDRQRPLIERGSTLINTLTGGSIVRLTAEFDARDRLHIVGVRADGSLLAPTGMSEGTRDQLYLALRVAAIEDYLTRAEALPVIADDLFINFDDDRAMAGLEVLAHLAEQTQVVLFTHHQHLRDMAATRLGSRTAVHDLVPVLS